MISKNINRSSACSFQQQEFTPFNQAQVRDRDRAVSPSYLAGVRTPKEKKSPLTHSKAYDLPSPTFGTSINWNCLPDDKSEFDGSASLSLLSWSPTVLPF
jgi:hypothetical protein